MLGKELGALMNMGVISIELENHRRQMMHDHVSEFTLN